MCGLNVERVTGKTRISYSRDVCKLNESNAFLVFMEIYINHFAPGNFAEKRVLKLVGPFFITVVLKRTKPYHKTAYTSYTLRPSDPDAKH